MNYERSYGIFIRRAMHGAFWARYSLMELCVLEEVSLRCLPLKYSITLLAMRLAIQGFGTGELDDLEAMLLLELDIFLYKSVDTINHALHQLHFGVTKPVFVGDIISDPSLTTRLATGSSWLHFQLFTPLL